MEIPRWKDPKRKRNTEISYKDPDYCKYYDIDLEDLTHIVSILKEGNILSEAENDRYGTYIITMSLIAMESPKFKNKTRMEREEILDYMTYELLNGITKFDLHRGSSIYSYAYRIAWVAGIHYYTDKINNYNKKQEIEKHCLEELAEYIDEISTHKVRSINGKD